MFKGFKEFAYRGNVIDLAVAVVAGAAITALVGDFTTAMVNPLIGLALGGGVDVGVVTVNGQVFDFTLLDQFTHHIHHHAAGDLLRTRRSREQVARASRSQGRSRARAHT